MVLSTWSTNTSNMSGTNSTTASADHFVAVYIVQVVLCLMLAGVCLISRLQKSPISDYQNIEFVDIETAPMFTYDEFRPQEASQTDTGQIDAEEHKTVEDPQHKTEIQTDVKTDDSKVDNELE